MSQTLQPVSEQVVPPSAPPNAALVGGRVSHAPDDFIVGQSAIRAVVVQSGARDAYQVALALAEAGMLDTLVTDLFWPCDRAWARALTHLLPRALQEQIVRRSAPRLPSRRVRQLLIRALRVLLSERLPVVSAASRRATMRAADAALGHAAGTLARKNGSALLSYSYYGYDAFRAYGRPGILFQLHPHPATMRRLLSAELAAHPDCAASLRQEWELALPEDDYNHLVRETEMASAFLVASSFTRSTLIEHGADPQRIGVIPYGVDTQRFSPAPDGSTDINTPLQLLFVGRINQRKGIKYLLEALRLLRTQNVHLTICGRVVDSLELFRPFSDQVTIRPSVSEAELAAAYRSADLFVFPSVAEGFGQVLLESLASGLPVLSTTHTAAPDLIEHGREGFVVAPGDTSALAERIEWALTHRADLLAMRPLARACAERFTWERFRRGVVDAVHEFAAPAAPIRNSGPRIAPPPPTRRERHV